MRGGGGGGRGGGGLKHPLSTPLEIYNYSVV